MSHAAHMTPTHNVKVLSVTFKVHTSEGPWTSPMRSTVTTVTACTPGRDSRTRGRGRDP